MGARREPVNPPVDGSVNLPEILDFNLKYNAELPMFAFNRDGSDEITEISYLEFARACDRVAHAIRPRRIGRERQVVAFMALADSVVYQAITLGLMRAGLVVCHISLWLLSCLSCIF